jgi:hypothetical protein
MLIVHSIISTTLSRLRNNLLVSYVLLLPAALFLRNIMLVIYSLFATLSPCFAKSHTRSLQHTTDISARPKEDVPKFLQPLIRASVGFAKVMMYLCSVLLNISLCLKTRHACYLRSLIGAHVGLVKDMLNVRSISLEPGLCFARPQAG